jgi:hypothetical protein
LPRGPTESAFEVKKPDVKRALGPRAQCHVSVRGHDFARQKLHRAFTLAKCRIISAFAGRSLGSSFCRAWFRAKYLACLGGDVPRAAPFGPPSGRGCQKSDRLLKTGPPIYAHLPDYEVMEVGQSGGLTVLPNSRELEREQPPQRFLSMADAVRGTTSHEAESKRHPGRGVLAEVLTRAWVGPLANND